jgi:hypothetical protein
MLAASPSSGFLGSPKNLTREQGATSRDTLVSKLRLGNAVAATGFGAVLTASPG